MDLKELLKLAEKDKEAAVKQFSEKYGANQVSYFDKFHYSDKKMGYKINPNKKHITIEDLELMKRFTRHFGHLMEEVKVICDNESSFKWTDMIELIQSHCTALRKLHFLNDIFTDDPVEIVATKVKRSLEFSRNPLCFTKPFATIEVLKIENIYLDSSMKFDEIFPSLRLLDLLGIGFADPSIIEVNYSKLEHLGIAVAKEYDLSPDEERWVSFEEYLKKEVHLMKIDEESDVVDEVEVPETNKIDENMNKGQLSWTNIKSAFASNPQIQSIHLDMDVDVSMIEFINRTLPDLQKIVLTCAENDFDDHSLEGDIIFEHVTNASLGHLGRNMPPLTFEKLECLEFTTKSYQSTIDFIKKHPNLKSLQLNCEYTDIKAIRVIKALLNLTDLYMIIGNEVKWCARSLIQFLSECERLETLMLMVLVDSKDQPNWRSLVAKVWQIDEGYTKDLYTIEKTDFISDNTK